jgi:precorrin-6A/cobalt-precorrin-6A reductase
MAGRVLILGGTGEALELAAGLEAEGIATLTSLAGVTRSPRLPGSTVRLGGFGGAEGLTRFLEDERFAAIADATHPFAARMSWNARAAAAAAGTPLFRLERPAWNAEPEDQWTSCASSQEAARALPRGARVLLTIGSKEVSHFVARQDVTGLARMIEEPAIPFPPRWRAILERPPFSLKSELQLITHHAITHLVTKNAGGAATFAKVAAARALSLPVLMIERPIKPEASCFPTVAELIPAVRRAVLP